LYMHRNQQYSIIALTDAAGTIVERYTYTAYGAPTFLDASASPLTPPASSLDNRITYTGREWDSTLHLHHFRARMLDPQLGRFCGRNPIGYVGGLANLFLYCAEDPINYVDPLGLRRIPRLPPILDCDDLRWQDPDYLRGLVDKYRHNVNHRRRPLAKCLDPRIPEPRRSDFCKKAGDYESERLNVCN
ncbi:MAG: RHS repeat-associated core domain-containing protein, partial [Gammaproteobacteria bacterium]